MLEVNAGFSAVSLFVLCWMTDLRITLENVNIFLCRSVKINKYVFNDLTVFLCSFHAIIIVFG